MSTQDLTQREQELVEIKSKIEVILKEGKAALVPVTLISGQRVLSRVDIVPLETVNSDATPANN